MADHNIIDRSLLADATSTGSISQFGRKTRADLSLVLLEFSIDCDNRSHSKVRLREWFRVMDRPVGHKVVIRGVFDAIRMQQQCTYASAEETNPSTRQWRVRDSAPSRLSSNDEAWLSRDEMEAKLSAAKKFAEASASSFGDPKFVSLHPIKHHRLVRDVNHPPHPFPSDNAHASTKVNSNRYGSKKFIKDAITEAQLTSQTAKALRVLRNMVDLLPEDVRVVEQAALSALEARNSPMFMLAR